jgi:xanthine dehydrogenase accessory factor
MNVWNFIENKIKNKVAVALLCVLHSEGSSPGRQGFKMAVAADGSLYGSIGGGIMEHKLVEKARDMLAKGEREVFLKEQIHDKDSPVNQSGMICSGRQMVAIFTIGEKERAALVKLFGAIDAEQNGTLTLRHSGIFFEEKTDDGGQFYYHFTSEKDWEYRETIGFRNTVHIIGGGHVGLAFSKMMRTLGFYVKIYDDREGLNTIEQNDAAHEKHLVDFEKIGDQLDEGDNQYTVLMTFGYRTDKLILPQLLDKNFRYLGMMGSEKKVAQLYEELEAEGIPPEKLAKVFSPIGLPIFSKTPEEIAVSIAAEIIRVKNEGLPTGRK